MNRVIEKVQRRLQMGPGRAHQSSRKGIGRGRP